LECVSNAPLNLGADGRISEIIIFLEKNPNSFMMAPTGVIMKKFFLVILSLLSLNSFAADYYKDFKDHPSFQKKLKSVMNSYERVGKPFVKLQACLEKVLIYGQNIFMFKK
jgi:hypothetical protein